MKEFAFLGIRGKGDESCVGVVVAFNGDSEGAGAGGENAW